MCPTAALLHEEVSCAVQHEKPESQANATTLTVLGRDFISYSFFGREGKGRMGKCLKTN